MVLEILHPHKVEFAERYGVTKLGIFGSVARDDAAADSDVDIVFETETPNLFRTVRMKQELAALVACPVDVMHLRENMNLHLKQRILQEATYV
jgi:predicted nucleotidyltransferase